MQRDDTNIAWYQTQGSNIYVDLNFVLFQTETMDPPLKSRYIRRILEDDALDDDILEDDTLDDENDRRQPQYYNNFTLEDDAWDDENDRRQPQYYNNFTEWKKEWTKEKAKDGPHINYYALPSNISRL
ncbi:hypothetical protein L1987_86011 [Smallanthus sonchifolius]|uniref:Uncharacterized protein n=1 Tax=Smallanthus sonchifolius TaxID=185202 RepID=A0ACB8XXF2_9ASTR|nr:hypothetical protein L1987_86011 [Smallanthus sonchifolius]